MLKKLGIAKVCKICNNEATTADGKLQLLTKQFSWRGWMREYQW
jgi:hypothetical protein